MSSSLRLSGSQQTQQQHTSTSSRSHSSLFFSSAKPVGLRMTSKTAGPGTKSTGRPQMSPKNTMVWPRPSASINSLIDTGSKSLGDNKAWTVKGPAQRMYETKVRPGLLSLLRNNSILETDGLFLNKYMIGPNEAEAAPMMVVCCINEKIRDQVVQCIQESGILRQYHFRLGASPLCLEAMAPPLHCTAASRFGAQLLENVPMSQPNVMILGRTVTFPSSTRKPRTATGGIVVRVGCYLFQVTAAQVLGGYEEKNRPTARVDLNEVYLDCDEFKGECHDIIGNPALSSGSSTTLSNNSNPDGKEAPCSSPSKFSGCVQSLPECNNVSKEERALQQQEANATPQNVSLGYHLVPIGPASEADRRTMNTIYLQHNSTGKVSLGKSTIHVKDIADVSGSSTVVIVVTASKGIVQGMLMPGAISYRRPGSSIFQDIYAVNIQGTVEEVDVGASVVSRTKGLLYGHIILGAPGTSLAYMAPASHVLREIREKTGEDVSLDLRLLHTRDTVYNGAEYPRVQQWSSGVFRTQGSEFMDVETWVNKSRKPFDGALDVEIEDKVLLSNFSMKQAASTIKATVTTNQPIPRKSKTSTIRATLSSGSSPDDVRKTARAQCTLCDEFPDGFRGKHELRRHHKAKHSSTATRYVCRDPHTVGMLSPIRPGVPLAACQPCRNKKPYTAYYNAAAHLRRCHFNARGSGRNNRHSMADLRPWLEEIWLRDGLDQDIEVVIAGEEKKTNNGKDEADEENGRTVEEKCRAKEETSRADDEDTVSYICLDDAMSSAPYPIDPGFFSVEAEQMMLSDWPDAAEIIDVKSNVELKHDPSFTVDYDIFNSSHDSEFMHTTSPEYKTNTASTMDSSFAQDCETCFYSPSQDRWTDILPTSGEGDTPMFLHGCDDWELEVHQSVSTYVNGSLPPAITAETLVDLRLEKAKCSDGTPSDPKPRPFLCQYDGCKRGLTGNGFAKRWNLDDHTRRVHKDIGISGNTTSAMFVCSFPSCQATPFRRSADLKRHTNLVHEPIKIRKQYYCDYPSCDRAVKPCPRGDHFRDHLRKSHGEHVATSGHMEDKEAPLVTILALPWWRCAKCLGRVVFNVHGDECPNCPRLVRRQSKQGSKEQGR